MMSADGLQVEGRRDLELEPFGTSRSQFTIPSPGHNSIGLDGPDGSECLNPLALASENH